MRAVSVPSCFAFSTDSFAIASLIFTKSLITPLVSVVRVIGVLVKFVPLIPFTSTTICSCFVAGAGVVLGAPAEGVDVDGLGVDGLVGVVGGGVPPPSVSPLAVKVILTARPGSSSPCTLYRTSTVTFRLSSRR
ncbi:hypothetical protein D3C73_1275460 [compost metagenome]